MRKTIGLLLPGIMILYVGNAVAADLEHLKSQAYGIWEVDAKDVAEIIRKSTRGSDKPARPRILYEFTEKTLTVHIINAKATESRSGEIWWIFPDNKLHFSDGKADNRIVFLDTNTMRVEFDDRVGTKILMRRSSASPAELGALLTAAQEPGLEENIIMALKSYATGQVTFQVAKLGRNTSNTKTGPRGYADNFRNLYYGIAANQNTPLKLISKEIADAFQAPPLGAQTVSTPNNPPGKSVAYQGYFFLDDPTKDCSNNFGLFAIPAPTSPGSKVYWIDERGVVLIREIQPGESMSKIEHPSDASSKWLSH